MGPPGQASLYFTDPWNNVLELCAMRFSGTLCTDPFDLAPLCRRAPAPTG